MYNKKPAILILDNGRKFSGYAFGKIGTTIGEVCFNTGMSGYQEILTDPSYCGQLVTMTYPHIGNYGVNDEDIESAKIQVGGFIVKEGSSYYSNYRASDSLENILKENNIIGIQGLDTRALVRCIRDEGAMNGIISSKILNEKDLINTLKEHPCMNGLDLAKQVTCDKSYYWNQSSKKYKVAAIDYGIKYNILRLLEKEDCTIKVFPASVSSEEIMKYNPDGIFLSNGPGDPAAVSYGVKTVKELLEFSVPIFGICLGHQILSIALGATTYKLKFGHRGCNHPVKNIDSGIIEITSQNHGFAVDKETLPENVITTHTSLNDDTIEGIKSKNYSAFSVQYHPESSPGPHDSRYLFENFIDLMKQNKKVIKYAKTN